MNKLLHENVFTEAYYKLKNEWESNQQGTWLKLKEEKRITDEYCEFIMASKEYIVKFYFHFVYDSAENVPENMNVIMKFLEHDAESCFLKFIDIYMEQNPSFDIEPGQQEVWASFEVPFVKLENVVGFFLQTQVYARISQAG